MKVQANQLSPEQSKILIDNYVEKRLRSLDRFNSFVGLVRNLPPKKRKKP